MNFFSRHTLLVLTAALVFFPALDLVADVAAFSLTVVPDHADGLYALDEKATWTVDVRSGERAALTAVPYSVKRDGADEVAQGTVDLSTGPATVTATRSEPGALLVVFPSLDKPAPGDRTVRLPIGAGGALFGAGKIGPTSTTPDDFDAFWQGKLAALAAVPPNPVVEPGSWGTEQKTEGFDYCKVTLDNVGGAHVQGQLARPRAGEKFPAILMLQYAGVYPLPKRPLLNLAREGWLALNIQAHDIPVDGPPELYAELGKATLNNYASKGNEDRDQAYFVQMFLGCVRAAEYLASRPDWDGKILVATGTSQGGLQSFVTAALFPKVTHLIVLVPAGCDFDSPLGTPPRGSSWPYWTGPWGAPNRDMKKVRETGRYFDAVSFAARAKCAALVAVGLIDQTARPTGVLAAYNALPNAGEKELLPLPLSNHQGSYGAQAPYVARSKEWRTAIAAGQPVTSMKASQGGAGERTPSTEGISPVGN